MRRQDKHGNYVNKSLAELSDKDWASTVAAFLERGVIPVRVLTDEEIKERESEDAQRSTDAVDAEAS